MFLIFLGKVGPSIPIGLSRLAGMCKTKPRKYGSSGVGLDYWKILFIRFVDVCLIACFKDWSQIRGPNASQGDNAVTFIQID